MPQDAHFSFLQGGFTASWLDESDCVGAWESDAVAAVLFPTGGTLPDVRSPLSAADLMRDDNSFS